jgi:hypothetical protein
MLWRPITKKQMHQAFPIIRRKAASSASFQAADLMSIRDVLPVTDAWATGPRASDASTSVGRWISVDGPSAGNFDLTSREPSQTICFPIHSLWQTAIVKLLQLLETRGAEQVHLRQNMVHSTNGHGTGGRGAWWHPAGGGSTPVSHNL